MPRPRISEIAVELGAEWEDALFDVLLTALRRRATDVTLQLAGMAGSQELVIYAGRVKSRRIELRAETYAGIQLKGAIADVAAIARAAGIGELPTLVWEGSSE